MKVIVTANAPTSKLFSAAERASLKRAGVTTLEIHAAWKRALTKVLADVYPEDSFTVLVFGNGEGEFTVGFSPEGAPEAVAEHTARIRFAVELAAAAWVASLGTFAGLIERHRKAVYS